MRAAPGSADDITPFRSHTTHRSHTDLTVRDPDRKFRDACARCAVDGYTGDTARMLTELATDEFGRVLPATNDKSIVGERA